VSAQFPRHEDTTERFADLEARAGDEIELRAEAAVYLEGTAPGATEISVFELDGDGYESAYPTGPSFRIGPLRAGRYAIVAQGRDGYAVLRDVRGGARGVTLELGAGATIAGRLVDAAGTSRRGLVLFTWRDLPRCTFRAEAGADGRFRLAGVPAGKYWYRYTPPDAMSFPTSGIRSTATVEAGTEDLEVVVAGR
jgi:hypothetical protein